MVRVRTDRLRCLFGVFVSFTGGCVRCSDFNLKVPVLRDFNLKVPVLRDFNLKVPILRDSIFGVRLPVLRNAISLAQIDLTLTQ